ncbi:hypothetical protein KAM376D_42990 [Aeromonas caviae]|nr:DUF3379 family protein [Aeromonas caviae]BCR29193.1 hypothetical protein KAM376_21990 [Aeromonas caviae]GJC20793.1 hypothetical protein KAM377_42750 [Aeromonas caviae]GJC29804.1 hypothetical protein KAM376D_42990 [Aeromonas caviae]
MDELEFRRRAITHPSDRDPAFLKAAEASPANRKHLDEMQQLERQVRSTLEVDVPAGLAERILLRQAMAAEEEQVVPLPVTPARTPWRALAIAASVAFLLGMSTRWISWPVAPDTLSLAQVAMSHVYGEEPFIHAVGERPRALFFYPISPIERTAVVNNCTLFFFYQTVMGISFSI